MIDLEFHSPVEEINNPLFIQKQVKVFIKRDDLIHPFISGNKWRKLKYILQKASWQQKTRLVTFGGAYSNHLLATACAAARFGFKSTGFVRGEMVQNPTLAVCRLFGMELIFANRSSYRDKQQLFNNNFNEDKEAFFIDEGGACDEAVEGCAELIAELQEPFDHIFCAFGTGTTAAGLLKGIEKTRLATRMHAVPVLKPGDFIRKGVQKYFSNEPEMDLHTSYHFGGYAKTTQQLLEFIQRFASSTGIMLDPVYTAKTAYAVFDLIEKNSFKPDSKILMIHTGGLFGLFGKLSAFHG